MGVREDGATWRRGKSLSGVTVVPSAAKSNFSDVFCRKVLDFKIILKISFLFSVSQSLEVH